MKKIFTLVVAAMMAAGAMAQTWYLGGDASLGISGAAGKYSNAHNFSLTLSPMAGYEFNDKWAIEFGGAIAPGVSTAAYKYADQTMKDTYAGVSGGVFVYGRYTIWNSGILFIDLKFGDEFSAKKDAFADMLVFIPQLRVRVHDHVDLGVTLGRAGLGVSSMGNNTTTFEYMLQAGAGVNCAYRF